MKGRFDKVYCIYMKGNNGLEPYLYAYTHDKKVLELFKEQRNMNLFEVIEHSKDEVFVTIGSKYANRYLLKMPYQTSSDNELHDYETVEIAITAAEDFEVEMGGEDLLTELAKSIKGDAYHYDGCFKEEINNALEHIGYNIICSRAFYDRASPYGVIYTNENIENQQRAYYNRYHHKIDIYDYEHGYTPQSIFKPDKLNIFILKFGNTLKDGGLK